jgi:hypothetical protein
MCMRTLALHDPWSLCFLALVDHVTALFGSSTLARDAYSRKS